MARIHVLNLDSSPPLPDAVTLTRVAIDPTRASDVTFINLNLMLINQRGRYDQQNCLPLGVLYLAAFLKEHGYYSELIDYQLFSHARLFDVDGFLDAVAGVAPVVGISCMTNLLPFAVLCAKELKRRFPACKVVLGGTGPSPLAREITEAFPFVDSVVTGEGELPLLDMLQHGFTPTPPRQLVKDLDRLPLPAYSLVDFASYDAAPSIIASRGCPYSCTFCTEPHNFGGSVRFRSADRVVAELELVHARSSRQMFLFQDDTLPLNRQRFDQLLTLFPRLSFPITWKCFGRVDLMDETLMADMAAHGCVQVRYGIEAGSNVLLKKIRKGFTIEKAMEVVQQSLRHFPSVHVSFIWGYPFETPGDLEETLRYVAAMEDAGATVLLFEFSPLAGSEIFREHHDGLEFDPDDYSFFVVTGHETVRSGRYETRPTHDAIYQLIRDYPRVFCGFYRYANTAKLKSRKRLTQFWATRRTPMRNEYDL